MREKNELVFFIFVDNVFDLSILIAILRRSEFDNCNLLRHLVLIATIAENPTLHMHIRSCKRKRYTIKAI